MEKEMRYTIASMYHPQPQGGTKISAAEIRPGDVIDGGYIGYQLYYRLEHITESSAVRVAALHYAVEAGSAAARKRVAALNQRIFRVARLLARQGRHMYMMSVDSNLSAMIWIAEDVNRLAPRPRRGDESLPWVGSRQAQAGAWHVIPGAQRSDVWLRRIGTAMAAIERTHAKAAVAA